MKVLLLGSGGREHALAWKIVQSPKLGKLYVAPGNAGTAQLAENVSLAVTDFRAIGMRSDGRCLPVIHLIEDDPASDRELFSQLLDHFLISRRNRT